MDYMDFAVYCALDKIWNKFSFNIDIYSQSVSKNV